MNGTSSASDDRQVMWAPSRLPAGERHDGLGTPNVQDDVPNDLLVDLCNPSTKCVRRTDEPPDVAVREVRRVAVNLVHEPGEPFAVVEITRRPRSDEHADDDGAEYD